ncbi:TnsA endonuclease N-terminal domain-containing protein [Chitiniphilus eburneus]|uniref:Heteromeric transposase endonuclease subunit TnsA n=1 Tax=Chitiniphilus eburneus TaxID=2571148 RepID=A0A4U0Q8L2_9NEIS|nr:TnsA endonuclease N-terminal domain-containing protein [Chitiniphilus eburneus]TJZ77525.1 heteromeric transposase endonuclease subunit TnsA [Chitiniphilus eburneus]
MDDNLRFGPVREINMGSHGVTGTVPGIGDYESTLERDLMEILRFDPDVERVDPQPLKIPYLTRSGQEGFYTPDGLIIFKHNVSSPIQPILYEVKYRGGFRKDWKELMPKFRAAKTFAMNKGWRFMVYTEREIRTPYLKNARFLQMYRDRVTEPEMRQHVLQILWDLGEVDPELLLCALCSDPDNRAEMIPVLWNLIAVGAIGCDLNQPLTMRSAIWAEELCEA